MARASCTSSADAVVVNVGGGELRGADPEADDVLDRVLLRADHEAGRGSALGLLARLLLGLSLARGKADLALQALLLGLAPSFSSSSAQRSPPATAAATTVAATASHVIGRVVIGSRHGRRVRGGSCGSAAGSMPARACHRQRSPLRMPTSSPTDPPAGLARLRVSASSLDLATRIEIDRRRGCLVGLAEPPGRGGLARQRRIREASQAPARPRLPLGFLAPSRRPSPLEPGRSTGIPYSGSPCASDISRRRRPVRRRGSRKAGDSNSTREPRARRRRPMARARPATRDPPSRRSCRGARGTEAGSALQARRRFRRSAAHRRARTCSGRPARCRRPMRRHGATRSSRPRAGRPGSRPQARGPVRASASAQRPRKSATLRRRRPRRARMLAARAGSSEAGRTRYAGSAEARRGRQRSRGPQGAPRRQLGSSSESGPPEWAARPASGWRRVWRSLLEGYAARASWVTGAKAWQARLARALRGSGCRHGRTEGWSERVRPGGWVSGEQAEIRGRLVGQARAWLGDEL